VHGTPANHFHFLVFGEGIKPADVRFQVSLPTPFAVVTSVVVAETLPAVEAAYERAMIVGVAALCRHIPHKDIYIQ
jgi:hypothetical protein